MEKILITGANGFIGSHLSEFMVQKGFNVKALVEYNSRNSYGWLDESPYIKNIEVISGDIRDPGFCRGLMKEVTSIFHLAALIAIPFSYVATDSYIQTNVLGTLNMLEAARCAEIKKFIHTSTSEVYGSAQYVPIDESHPLQPQSPYSASKIGADALAMSYYYSHNLPICIARPFNTYGPRQSARAIIPTLISQIASGKDQISMGETFPTRDLNYVLDTCSGFHQIELLENSNGEIFNIGSGYEISMGDLFYKIRDLMGSKAKILLDEERVRPYTSEVTRLLASSNKLKSVANYEPKFSLDDGLKETIKWFLNPENLKLYKSDLYNI
jgi:NAD dependent epimerase/dehydratase